MRTIFACLLTVSCSQVQSAKTPAECAAIRSFYDSAQSELISKGACDTAPNISGCTAHVALREAFIASLKENQCPSKPTR